MKMATQWRTRDGYGLVSPTNAGRSLKLETGFSLLLENGHRLLLEDTKVTEKPRTEWQIPSKNATNWNKHDGYSAPTTAGEIRKTEQGVVRITEQGIVRVLEPTRFTEKPRTEWRDE